MTIEAVVGYPGNGKTYYCTNRAYKSMKKGQKVFSNYPIVGAYKITFEDLINYSFPQNSMVIIDECGRWFNSRSWASLPTEVFDLFTLHRHMQLDMLVAVQNFNRIDKALREVIELVWWARNNLMLPFFIYEGYYDVEQVGLKGEYQKKQLVSKFSRSRKLYDTHIMRDATNKDYMPEIPWSDTAVLKEMVEETKINVKTRIADMISRLRPRETPNGGGSDASDEMTEMGETHDIG